MNTCKTCRFYFEEHDTCRRYPPQNYTEFSYVGNDYTRHSRNAEHVMVEPTGWCGEYQKKNDEEKIS